MKKLIIFAVFMIICVFTTAAQLQDATFRFSADLTTIYTLGNADDTQYIGQPGAGAFRSDPTNNVAAKKNGYYTATHLRAFFNPFPWLNGYFRLYWVSRPGTFYLPLQTENVGGKDFDLSLDNMFARASIFEALDLDMPVELFFKAGKYKAQASYFGTVSRYQIEHPLFLMHTKTDFTYELGAVLEYPFRLSASFATNYLLTEAIERRYDEPGGMGLQGTIVPNSYAPSFLTLVQFEDETLGIKAELLYGQNVSGIFSGHAAGFSALYNLELSETMSLPVGLSFGFYEKNVDLLGRAVLANPPASEPDHTRDFRNSWMAGFGTGLRLAMDPLDINFNLAGNYSSIGHFYRDNLNVFGMSIDTQITLQGRYFIGGGFIAGTLMDATWKTKEGEDRDDFNHTFTFMENFGYEIYAGLNLAKNGRFLIGFNQNKGLSLNHMLEARTDGQMKYKQAGTEWADKLVEAGGLYIKFLVRF
jgi:hypothetical protein